MHKQRPFMSNKYNLNLFWRTRLLFQQCNPAFGRSPHGRPQGDKDCFTDDWVDRMAAYFMGCEL